MNKNLVGGVYWGDEQIFGLLGYSPHPPSRENPVQWWYVYKSRMRNCGKNSEYDSVSWEGAVFLSFFRKKTKIEYRKTQQKQQQKTTTDLYFFIFKIND